MEDTEREPSDEPLPNGLVVPVRLDPSGMMGPTEGQARGARWRRTSHGFYVPTGVDRQHPEQRIAEASVVLPEVAALTGWAALRWLGGQYFSGLTDGGRSELPVAIVTADANVRSQEGIHNSQERLDPGEVLFMHGLPVTLPARSTCFEARYSSSIALATVAWDMAAFHDLVSLAEGREYCAAHSGWTGIPRARDALDLAVENSWSPMETLTRLVWTQEARLPTPMCNVALFDMSGRHIGTPDLFDPERGVVCEYDGSLHLEGARRAQDLVREGSFRDHGLEYATVLANDLRVAGRVADRLWSAHKRASPVAASQRTWTITAPAWWRPTATVADRRQLANQGLGHLLPNRRAA